MACRECLRPCPEHNVTYCATCHHHPGECHVGDCERRATCKIVVTRNTTGAVVETVPACGKCGPKKADRTERALWTATVVQL